jgi:hypothetical protein
MMRDSEFSNRGKTAPPEFTQRMATPTDIPEIARLFRTSLWQAMPFLPDLHTPAEDRQYFAKILRKDHIAVAEQNGKIIGFCAFRDGWIDHLYVLPESQGSDSPPRRSLPLKNSANHSFLNTLWRFARYRKRRSTLSCSNYMHRVACCCAILIPSLFPQAGIEKGRRASSDSSLILPLDFGKDALVASSGERNKVCPLSFNPLRVECPLLIVTQEYSTIAPAPQLPVTTPQDRSRSARRHVPINKFGVESLKRKHAAASIDYPLTGGSAALRCVNAGYPGT